MGYVIKVGRNKYVAREGPKHSYTNNLATARVFESIEEANRNKCGNEYVISVSDEMRQ